MGMKDVRIAHLDAVLKDIYDGNKSAMARAAAERSKKSRNPSFFAELLGGKKSFGEKLARSLEDELRLEPKSLDEPIIAGSNVVPLIIPTWPFQFSRARYDRLLPQQKSMIAERVEGMIEAFEQEMRVPTKKKRRK